MAAKQGDAKPLRKATPRNRRIKKSDGKAYILKTEEVPITDLQVYYKNARIGNVDKIAKSLHLNGMFKPIVVNVGTLTGRPNEILAGNHTYMGAKKPLFWVQGKGDEQVTFDKPSWDTIWASFVDVDEERARAINLADNFTAEDGTYDERKLYEQLEDPLPSLAAAGLDDKRMQEILDKFKPEDIPVDLDNEDLEDVDLPEYEDGPKPKRPSFEETELGEEDDAEDVPSSRDSTRVKKNKVDEVDPEDEEAQDDPDGAGVEITSADEEIKGAYDLKDEMYFDHVGYWQIPRLRSDMLMSPDELPDNLTTWAGSATKHHEDPDAWWLYNWGIDSTAGMKDVSKVILSFYTYDEYFEPWWWGPSKYTAKCINSGIKYAVTPDFTDDTRNGRAFCLYQLYRCRWMSRYLQEAGIKIIPNISWPDGDIEYLKKFVLPTLPKNIPMIAFQMQTFSKGITDEHKDAIAAEFQLVIDTIQPELVLLYSGQPGYEFFSERVNYDGDVRFLLNRQAKLSAHRKGRKRKETI